MQPSMQDRGAHAQGNSHNSEGEKHLLRVQLKMVSRGGTENRDKKQKEKEKQNRKRGTDVQNRLLDSVREGEGGMFRENSIETCILSRVKQITSPGGMHETSARAWCTGKTRRNQVEREVGGGIRMENTCKSMADSCQCMTKPTTIL